MFRNVHVEFCKPPRHVTSASSVFSTEDSDVHLKDFSGTIEVVLQNQTTQITGCRNISYYL
jgi:hypothetical protein